MSDSKLDAAANAMDDVGSGLIRLGCFFLLGLPILLVCLALVGGFVVAVPWLGVPLLVAVAWAVIANYKKRVADQRVADQLQLEEET